MTNKTVVSKMDPIEFIKTLENDEKREDSLALIEYLEDTFRWEAKLWGKDMIGFGRYHYRYKSGRSGEHFIIGFSPKEKQFSFYTPLYIEGHEALIKKIGITNHGKACLYFKNTDGINFDALTEFIQLGIEFLQNQDGFEIIDDNEGK